jgi:FeS assembly SUF system protein
VNEERKIEIEQVDAVTPPPRARVDPPRNGEGNHAQHGGGVGGTAAETFERKRDYLAGFLSPEKVEEPRGGPGSDLQAAVIEVLKSIYDPEIPVDIYELGLIYNVEVGEDGDATITMTLTTPHCPVAESLPQEVELRAMSVPGIRDAVVNLVWDPPWDPSKMSDEARLELGML